MRVTLVNVYWSAGKGYSDPKYQWPSLGQSMLKAVCWELSVVLILPVTTILGTPAAHLPTSSFWRLNCCLSQQKPGLQQVCRHHLLPAHLQPASSAFCDFQEEGLTQEPYDGIEVLSIHTPGPVEVEWGSGCLFTSSTCLRGVPDPTLNFCRGNSALLSKALGSVLAPAKSN